MGENRAFEGFALIVPKPGWDAGSGAFPFSQPFNAKEIMTGGESATKRCRGAGDGGLDLVASAATFRDMETGNKEGCPGSGGHSVGKQLGGAATAGGEEAMEGVERPLIAIGFTGEHVVEKDLGSGGRLRHGFLEIA